MNRRLRKKKHVGEFQELGFEVRGELTPGLADDNLEAFVGRLMEAAEERKLAFAGSVGGSDAKLDGFVMCNERGSTTTEDQAALAAFLEGDASVVKHEVGDLTDAWR